MSKVFLYTYWFMWGTWSGDKPKLVERAWLTSVLPPFYKGQGVAFRIGKRSLKIGLCHPRMPVTVDPDWYVGDMDANLDAVLGFEMDEGTKEVRTWVSSTRPIAPEVRTSSGASSPD